MAKKMTQEEKNRIHKEARSLAYAYICIAFVVFVTWCAFKLAN